MSSAFPPPLTPAEELVRIAHRLTVSTIDGYLLCTLCDKRFWSMDFAADHLASQKHRSALWAAFVADPANGVMGNPAEGIPVEIECRGDAWFECKLCNCKLWCFESTRAHCSSKNHRQNFSSQKAFATIPRKIIPPPPTRVPLAELPAGFAYTSATQIQCVVCDEAFFQSSTEAWHHSVSDYGHLRNLHERIRSLFTDNYAVVSNELYCELCACAIVDPLHFNAPKHRDAIDKLHKLNMHYFQPFRDHAGSIQLFSWTHGCVLTDSSVPPKQLVTNNPQLLISQWTLLRGELPGPEWPIACVSADSVQRMLAAHVQVHGG